jgi:hypothetical protein
MEEIILQFWVSKSWTVENELAAWLFGWMNGWIDRLPNGVKWINR